MDQIQFFLQKTVKKKFITKNEVLTESNVSVKRPAPLKNVIPARKFFSILGKKASKNIIKDRQIKWNDIK